MRPAWLRMKMRASWRETGGTALTPAGRRRRRRAQFRVESPGAADVTSSQTRGAGLTRGSGWSLCCLALGWAGVLLAGKRLPPSPRMPCILRGPH